MIRSVILDDEINSAKSLKWKLENFCPQVQILHIFSDPLEALHSLRQDSIDLLFLDIEMPNMNGFDVLEAVGKVSFDVIFTTAYNQYGIQAVKFSAFDYLMKPIRNKELIEAIERYSESRAIRKPGVQVESLLQNIETESKTGLPGKITLATKESLELVEPKEILYCESDSNYTHVFMIDGRRKIISRTLRDFEEMLVPFDFFRPHNSFLVNMDEVREYVRSDGGYLVLKNKKQIPVSKSKKDKLLEYF